MTFESSFGQQAPYVPCHDDDLVCFISCDPILGCGERCVCPADTTNSVPPEGFTSPTGIDWLDASTLIIADRGNSKLQHCSAQGSCSWIGADASLGTRNNPGTFTRPHGIEINRMQEIAVADQGNYAVQVCDDTGGCTFIGNNSSIGNMPSSRLGEWDEPRDAAYNPAGELLGLDTGNDRIQVLNPPDWNVVRTYQLTPGTDAGQFSGPSGIAMDSSGRMVIADTGNHRLQVCEESGRQLTCNATLGRQGSNAGEFESPVGVDIDALGRIWVADTGNHRIQVCQFNGDCLVFGAFGGGPGEFNEPHDVAVHPTGQVAVVDSSNHRIQLFRTEAAFSINAGMNDAWINLDTLGQGFFITAWPGLGKVFIAQFTFDAQAADPLATAVVGGPNQRWVTAIGDIDGASGVLAAELTSGGLFDAVDPVPDQVQGYGTYTITFHDCMTATLTYDFPELGLSGTIPLQRAVSDNATLCEVLQNG